MKRVKEVIYTSQEQAFHQFKEKNKDNKIMFEVIAPDVFNASIKVYLLDASLTDRLISSIKNRPYVQQVD